MTDSEVLRAAAQTKLLRSGIFTFGMADIFTCNTIKMISLKGVSDEQIRRVHALYSRELRLAKIPRGGGWKDGYVIHQLVDSDLCLTDLGVRVQTDRFNFMMSVADKWEAGK